MPTYLYECEKHGEFEEFHSITIELEECPQCKEEKLPAKKPKKLIFGGSGKGIVHLTGHELMSKTKDDINKMRGRASRDEKFVANIVGESKYHNNQKR